MAIYHFSVKNISRSKGRSAIACAAYRSGEKLEDERYGKTQDYTKKKGIEFTHIYAPDNAKQELLNRESLWNAVERNEKRKDAHLANEFEIAFPHEFSKEQRQIVLSIFCKTIVFRHNVVVDAAIHAPHVENGSDERNYHAHILFTARQLDQESGDFAKIKNRDFNKEHGVETVKQWREEFADLLNFALEKIGSKERVSHKSNKELNNGLEATIHEGSKVTTLRRRGIDTEISLKNDAIQRRNHYRKSIQSLEQDIVVSKNLVQQINKNNEIRYEEAGDTVALYNRDAMKLAKGYAEKYNQSVDTHFNNELGKIQQKKRQNIDKLKVLGERPKYFGKVKYDETYNEYRTEYRGFEKKQEQLKKKQKSSYRDSGYYFTQAVNAISKNDPGRYQKYQEARRFIQDFDEEQRQAEKRREMAVLEEMVRQRDEAREKQKELERIQQLEKEKNMSPREKEERARLEEERQRDRSSGPRMR